ncbi:unnamed protein product, partial [Citrullus colocynthis]
LWSKQFTSFVQGLEDWDFWYESDEKNAKMNQVLAIENEELRAEVRRLVQQATSNQRQLKEATRCLQKQPKLEKERDSLNIEAIQMKKKNKRLLRDVDVFHNETKIQKECIKELKQELERMNKVVANFQSALDKQAASSQKIVAEVENLQNSTKEYKSMIVAEVENLQNSAKEYKSQLIEAEHRNILLQEVVTSFKHQLLMCYNVREVVTDDYAQLKKKYQKTSVDFAIWRDEYSMLRRDYDNVKGQIEQAAEKLRQMAKMADQFAAQATISNKAPYLYDLTTRSCLVF